jgi:hypothetical protein
MSSVCCLLAPRSRAAAAGPAEAELLRALRHPNVVMYLGASLVPGEQVRRCGAPALAHGHSSHAALRGRPALCCLSACAPHRTRAARDREERVRRTAH